MNPLLEQIRSELPWLLDDLGFQVVLLSYDPAHFGDCVVVLESLDLRLRFTRDRGQILLYLAPTTEPAYWNDLDLFLGALHSRPPSFAFDLATVGSLLRENYQELVDSLGPKLAKTRRELERCKRERALRLRSKQ